MRGLLTMLILAAGLKAQSARPSRVEIAAMEKMMDQRLARFDLERPVELLGPARGVYLDGCGAVFTAEVNLLGMPGLSPFRPQIGKEDVAKLREQKLKRLPQLRALMQELMVAAAQSLDRLPGGEQVVLALMLWSHPWEDSAGLPRVIQMEARRDALLDVALDRRPRNALAQIVRVRED